MTMYLNHFGLREAPFSITPHTELFFPGANRGAMLDALAYATTHDEGIIKVTGEVGSGKTMLCRMLLEKLPGHIETVYLATPTLSRDDILLAIAEELGLKLTEWRTHQLTRALQARLLEIHAAGRRVAVLIDEAHAMPTGTLEEIRLLSNLETGRHKLLHIVLFGQPELDERLNRQDMRQLKDRITHNFALEPLCRSDIGNYLMFRLRAAGYRGPDLFTAEALQLIHKASQGLTRRINILADKALLAAFSQGQHLVSSRLAKTAVRDAQFTPMRNPEPRKPALAIGAAAIAVLLGAAWWAISAGLFPEEMLPPLLHQPQSDHPAAPTDAPRQITQVATAPEKSVALPIEQTLNGRIAATEEWLQNTPDMHYLIQLFSTENNEKDGGELEVERFLSTAAGLEPQHVHIRRSQREDGGSRLDILYGDYPDREAAEAEMGRLPQADTTAIPRIRTIGELKGKGVE